METVAPPPGAHADPPARRGELERVRQQVAEHLVPQAVRIRDDDGRHRRRQLDREIDPLAFRQCPERALDAAEQLGRVDLSGLDREPAGLDAAQVDELVHHPGEHAGLFADRLERLALPIGRRPVDLLLEQLGVPADDVDRRLEIVGHDPHELGPHPLELGQSLGHRAERARQIADLVAPAVRQLGRRHEPAGGHARDRPAQSKQRIRQCTGGPEPERQRQHE